MAKALLGDVTTDPVAGTVGTIVIERASTVLHESEEDRKGGAAGGHTHRSHGPGGRADPGDAALGQGIPRENLGRVEACEVTGEY